MLEPRRGGGDVDGASGQQPHKLRQDVAVGDTVGGGNRHVWADQGSSQVSTTLPFLSTLGVILSRYLEHPVSLMLWTDGEGSELNDDSGEIFLRPPCGFMI